MAQTATQAPNRESHSAQPAPQDPKGQFAPGLEGIIATETRVSRVDGEAGELVIAGFPVETIAPRVTFEEMVWLVWNDRLPTASELREHRHRLAGQRRLPELTIRLLRQAASTVDGMTALRMAAASLDLGFGDAIQGSSGPSRDRAAAERLVASFPPIVATYWRLRQGQEPVDPREDLSHTANYLYQLEGSEPDAARVRALDTYLNTVIDHGLNASTFTARVILSTESDLVSAIAGAIGALKGPLHGGAPGPALDLVREVGEATRAREVLVKHLDAGEKLMGFGHRVYRVRDPRAEVLSAASRELFHEGDPEGLYALTLAVEKAAVELFAERKPGRRIEANVELFTALLLNGIGLESELFSPTFAVSRVGGWTAHAFEQRAANRLIRPRARYVGDTGRAFVPIEER